MSSFVGNLDKLAVENDWYRDVVHTGPHGQLLVMSLPVGCDTGEECHSVDQFVYVVAGHGRVELDGRWHPAPRHTAVYVPAGTSHRIRNTSNSEALKLFVVSAPAHHPPRTIHRTQHDAHRAAIDGALS